MSQPEKIPTLTLADGYQIPALGLGTFSLKGHHGVGVMSLALEQGYRMLDSAVNYENEGAVGQALRLSKLNREDAFITSKLPGRHHHYHEAVETIEESLFRAQLNYFDLYLIHWPNPQRDLYVEAWQALIDAQKKGQIRSIGVSNFLPEHIDRLKKETGILPVINQIELHPYFNQEAQRQYHQEHHIITMGWSPLGRGLTMLEDPVLQQIAAEHGRSVAQVILRWHVQCGVIPIPRSSQPENQRANQAIFQFELTPAQMQQINRLNRVDGRLKNQDPAVYEEL